MNRSSQPSHFRTVVEFVLDNLFDIATILVAAYLVVRYQVVPVTVNDLPEITTWILAVLGLISVSGLWDRNRKLRRIENIAEESRDLIRNRLSGRVQASEFFLQERKLSNKTFASASTIFLTGFALTRTAREYNSILAQRLVAGATIRIIIIDPAIESVLKDASLKSIGATAEHWRSRLEVTETALDAIANTPGAKGKIEIGYLPYTPSFGFVMIDPYEAFGFAYVEIYHHKSVEFNATFELKAADDPQWYDFFRRQYEVLWGDCRTKQFPRKP